MSPLTVQLVVDVVQLRPPGDEITVYDVTAEPPSDDGADHETSTEESPNTPDIPVGAPGTVAGTTADDADEAEPAPALFVAVTVNVYDVPFARPLTVHEVVELVQRNDPGEDVTV